jgi:hypothetical protein
MRSAGFGTENRLYLFALTVPGGGLARSFRPRPIALGAIRVVRETAAIPPYPAAFGFGSGKKEPLPFVKMRQYRCLALAKRIFIDHPQRYDAGLRWGIPPTPLPAEPIQLFPDGR